MLSHTDCTSATGQVATTVATTAGEVATVMSLRQQALQARHPQVHPWFTVMLVILT